MKWGSLTVVVVLGGVVTFLLFAEEKILDKFDLSYAAISDMWSSVERSSVPRESQTPWMNLSTTPKPQIITSVKAEIKIKTTQRPQTSIGAQKSNPVGKKYPQAEAFIERMENKDPGDVITKGSCKVRN